MTKLYLAIPCYNEEDVLWDSAEKLLNKYYDMMSAETISPDSKIVFIDDGSKDRTWDIIKDLHNQNAIFQGIKLSRNRGHQNALLAGLMTLRDKADAVISIDADLQDDINVFDEMVRHYENGCDVCRFRQRLRLRVSLRRRHDDRLEEIPVSFIWHQ